jgi:hypothetical protein
MIEASRRRNAARLAAAFGVFAFLAYVRTRGISQTFWFLGDQILYWRIAIRPWRELPIGGGPSSVGGTTLGPVFVWTLWGIRHLVGPWTDNLPHAGGIGLSLIQSAADAVLLVAIWERWRSLALALAVVVLVATAPYDMALTATIWNPPLSVAFVKVTIALALVAGERNTIAIGAAATATALLAVQAHSSAIFLAAPVAASFTGRELLARRWDRAWRQAGASALAILLLEVPFAANFLINPRQQTAPTVVVRNVGVTLAHPGRMRVAESFTAIASAMQFILARPWVFPWLGVFLAASAVVAAYRMRDDLVVVCATVVPLVLAGFGFSLWQLRYDDYWFLTLAPSAALTVALALTAWRPIAPVVSIVLAALVLVAVPARLGETMTIHRLPEYGALVRGSREIRRHTPVVRSIDTQFALPDSTDRRFLYEVLGGRIAPDAPFGATITADGHAIFTAARRPAEAGRYIGR